MCLCWCLGEAEALVLWEEDALAQLNVVNLVPRVPTVDLLPGVGGKVTFTAQRNDAKLIYLMAMFRSEYPYSNVPEWTYSLQKWTILSEFMSQQCSWIDTLTAKSERCQVKWCRGNVPEWIPSLQKGMMPSEFMSWQCSWMNTLTAKSEQCQWIYVMAMFLNEYPHCKMWTMPMNLCHGNIPEWIPSLQKMNNTKWIYIIAMFLNEYPQCKN